MYPRQAYCLIISSLESSPEVARAAEKGVGFMVKLKCPPLKFGTRECERDHERECERDHEGECERDHECESETKLGT